MFATDRFRHGWGNIWVVSCLFLVRMSEEVVVPTNHRTTVADLMCYLRQRLLQARDRKEQTDLTALLSTFDVLRSAAWTTGDDDLSAIIQDMIDAVQDSLMGVEWKSDIPSEEFIVATLS